MNGLEVLERQFRLDRRNVREGVDPSIDVNDVFVLEAADDVGHRVRLADVAKKRVPFAFSLRRAADEAGDIDEVDGGRHHFGGGKVVDEGIEALVGDGYDTDVRFDGAECVVGRFRLLARERVKKRGLSDVREPDDAYRNAHPSLHVRRAWPRRRFGRALAAPSGWASGSFVSSRWGGSDFGCWSDTSPSRFGHTARAIVRGS